MRRAKHHFHAFLTLTLACYCIWLLWVCHTAYTAFDNAFLHMMVYIVGLFK